MKNLDEAIQDVGGALGFLRKVKDTSIAGPGWSPPLIIPQVPFEFSCWEEEMRSWRENVALMDQTHHIPELHIKGPDAHSLLCKLACNSLLKSRPNRAHQMVCVNPEGYLLGDGILFNLSEGEFMFQGSPTVAEWIKFNAAKTGANVSFELDERSPVYANGHGNTRKHFRYQIQGAKAGPLLEKLNGAPLDDVKFFHLTELTIAGHELRALRHGMAGAPGLEIWGPWDLRDEIRSEILRQGAEFGITPVGAAAYLAGGMESGWIHWIVPAVFDVPSMDEFRNTLPADGWLGVMRLTGSFSSTNIHDYYKTPYDFGYGHVVKFDHEFIGRDALAAMEPSTSQKNVTLVWNSEDAGKLLAEMCSVDGKRVRFLHLPANGDKLEFNYDLLTASGQQVGMGYFTGYTANERAIITSATVDHDIEIGNEVVLHWGNSGATQGAEWEATTFPIRTTVAPAPYSPVARTEYAPGWRRKVEPA